MGAVLIGWAQVAATTRAAATDAPKPAPQVLYVATNGNDQWSGTVAKPTSDGRDGPLPHPTGRFGPCGKSELAPAPGRV